jgi:hypothetical protein
MRFSLLGLAVMPPCFVLGSRYGLAGVAGAWMVGYPLIMFPVYRRVFALLELRLPAYLKAIAPALGGSMLMLGAVAGIRLLTVGWAPTHRLLLEVGVGVLVYLTTTLLPQRERIQRILRHMRQGPQLNPAIP